MFSRGQLARCLSEIGEFAQGIAVGAEALRIAESVDQPVNVMYATHNLSHSFEQSLPMAWLGEVYLATAQWR